jgi:hypothetical protein
MDKRNEQMAHSADDPRVLAELSALADGSLDATRRQAVQARIDASPELTELYANERRVVELLHQARASDRAPARLRARLEAARPSRRTVITRRVGYAGSLAGALAAVALALVLILPAGTPGAPSVSQAVTLAARGAVAPPPPPDPRFPTFKLLETMGEAYFPNWQPVFGMQAVGQRSDRLGGHRAVTVYYEWRGTRIAYTIVSAPALAEPAASVTALNGTVLRTLRLDGRQVVTWRRANHTCVLWGNGVPTSLLQRLAAWKAPTVTAWDGSADGRQA